MGSSSAPGAVYDPVSRPAERRRVRFHPEPIRLVRLDSLPKPRRGACVEAQLFAGSGVVKPTGLEHSCFNGESVFLCSARSPIRRHVPCLSLHGSAPLKSILLTSAVL